MNLQLLITLLITSVLTISGWYFLHILNRRRDRENKKKDLRVDYLISAWKKLEYASNRDLTPEEFIGNIEKPLAEIQLFGTISQIQLAQDIMDEVSIKKSGQLNLILDELRNDLRQELNLERTINKMKHLRFKQN